MNYFEFQEKVEYLHELIKSRYKGTPLEFANKLEVPIRTFYRILDAVKAKYGNFIYDRSLKMYILIENKASIKK